MTTTPIPELEPKRKPEPELKLPRKPQPDIKQPATPAKPEVSEDQGDSGPDKDNPITQQSKQHIPVDAEDAHIGATEEQVSPTTPPEGDAYQDEPKQG